jgi:hypothetical protein
MPILALYNSILPVQIRAQLYLYKYIQEIELCCRLLNSKINSKKYEHMYRSENSNPGGQGRFHHKEPHQEVLSINISLYINLIHLSSQGTN